LQSYLQNGCFLEVPKLSSNEAEVILEKWLSSSRRTLQTNQKHIVLEAFKKCQLPLYLKLAFDEAYRWKSYSKDDETTLEENVEGTKSSGLSSMHHLLSLLSIRLSLKNTPAYVMS